MSTFIKSIILSLIVLLFGYDAFAQVPKKIIVEHFTNTWCDICTFTNPVIYETLNKQEGVLHITYHPSRPYPNCELHKTNPAENDGRTKYYNVYGSTPRLVIQGTSLSRDTDYSDQAIFEPYQNQTSPLSVVIEQFKLEDGSVEVKLQITNAVDHDLTAVKLFGGLAERLVEFDARNGEKEHFDVFRKSFTDVEGEIIRLDKNEGAVIELNFILPINETWKDDELFSFIMLQDEETKAVIQAEVTRAGEFAMPVSINESVQTVLQAFPNPVENSLHLRLPNAEIAQLKIYDTQGKLWINASFNQFQEIDVRHLTTGLYLIEVEQHGQRIQQKVLKQ